MLFLFLGLPGVLLAAILTAVIVAAGATTRRRDQALLRLRGAAPRQIMSLGAVETILVGLGGSLLGLAIAALAVRASFGGWGFGIGLAQSTLWAGGAALVGLALAARTILIPAWRDARQTSIAAARVVVGRHARPGGNGSGWTCVLLAGAGLVFWQQAQGGYELVLAPGGHPARFGLCTPRFAPLLLWAAAALLTCA